MQNEKCNDAEIRKIPIWEYLISCFAQTKELVAIFCNVLHFQWHSQWHGANKERNAERLEYCLILYRIIEYLNLSFCIMLRTHLNKQVILCEKIGWQNIAMGLNRRAYKSQINVSWHQHFSEVMRQINQRLSLSTNLVVIIKKLTQYLQV